MSGRARGTATTPSAAVSAALSVVSSSSVLLQAWHFWLPRFFVKIGKGYQMAHPTGNYPGPAAWRICYWSLALSNQVAG